MIYSNNLITHGSGSGSGSGTRFIIMISAKQDFPRFRLIVKGHENMQDFPGISGRNIIKYKKQVYEI